MKRHWIAIIITVIFIAFILIVVFKDVDLVPPTKETEETKKTDVVGETQGAGDTESASGQDEGSGAPPPPPPPPVYFKDSEPLVFELSQDSQNLSLGPILIEGSFKETDITIDDNKISDWIKPVVTKEGDGIKLMISEIPEDFREGSFGLVLAGGDKKQIDLKMEKTSWPVQISKTVNADFEDLSEPFEYKLENAVSVYGLSHIDNQLGFNSTYEHRYKNRSPACVYSFSDKDPVGEMHAIWDLGGRFLKDGGVVLGGVGANLGPKITKSPSKAGDELVVLETNDTGRKLLDDYCGAMGIPSGSLQITLPRDLLAAVYQTLFKVAVVDNEIDVDTVFKKDKEVSWRLKGNKDGYSILIQKSDIE